MDRPRIGRGVAILAVAALAVAVVSPAFGAAPVTKAKVKKLAKKQINKLVPGVAIEESELVRFGPVRITKEAPDQTLFSGGPFTIKGQCGTASLFHHARAIISTTEANSMFASNYSGTEDDFDPSDTSVWWTNVEDDVSDGADPVTRVESDGHAASPGGTFIQGHINAYLNLGGADCTFSGSLLHIAPA
jgi:hypothetical protein